jgi:hypothetical protein
MAYQRYPAGEAHDSYPTEHADLPDQKFNDGRLQKAICYLETEGSGDATDLYLIRVQAIKEHILERFLAECRSFDSRLYRRLQTLVREVQDDVEAVNNEESSDSDSSVKALFTGAEDNRDAEFGSVDNHVAAPSTVSDIDETGSILFEVSDVARPSVPQPVVQTKKILVPSPANNKEQVLFKENSRASSNDDVLEKRFLYGGPDNDPEVWYKKCPPLLHIGENPYSESWENMKINYDLAKSRGQYPGNLDSPPDFKRINFYDSGSRYKLPVDLSNEWSQNKDQYAEIQKLWVPIKKWFDAGRRPGESKARQENQDYAARLILPLVGDVYVKPFAKRNRDSITRIASAGQENSEVAADKISDDRLRTQSQRLRLQLSEPPRLRETNLKNFNSKREAATLRDQSETPSPHERAILRARAALATTPTPETRVAPRRSTGPKIVQRKQGRSVHKPQDPSYHPLRRLSRDADSPSTPTDSELEAETDDLVGAESAKRKRVRLVSEPKDPSYRPPRRLSQDADSPTTPDRATLVAEINELTNSAPAKGQRVRSQKVSHDPEYRPEPNLLHPTKRKRDERLDITPSSRKPKKSKASRKPTPASSMRVEFVGEEPAPATKAVPSNKATPAESSIKKPKRISAEDRELVDNETLARRGKTRSNRDFKPKRLRSLDETKR